jgi:hypothetical protein
MYLLLIEMTSTWFRIDVDASDSYSVNSNVAL